VLLSFDKKTDLLRFLAGDQSESQFLIVGGFQRLKRWTAFPLKPLTLLYGPNSAGKGAILDAQNIIRMLWSDDIDGLKISDAIARWHRGESGIALSVGFSCVDSLARMYDNDYWWDQYFPEWSQFPPLAKKLMSDEILATPRVAHRLTWIASWETALTHNPAMELFYGEQRVAALMKGKYDKSFPPAIVGLTFDALYIRRDMLEKYLGASLTKFEFFRDLRDLPAADMQADFRVGIFDYLWELSSLPEIYGSDFGGDHFLDFQVLLTVLFAPLPRSGMYRDVYIGPIRRVFSNEELKFWASGEPLAGAKTSGHQRLTGNGSDVWAEMAREVAKKEAPYIFRPGFAETGRDVLDDVNRWLESPQGFDSGYKITANTRLVVSTKLFKERGIDLQSVKSAGAKDTTAIVAFELEDREGRKLSLNDVGTGFSQLIPVIIALFQELHGRAFFEQPELHLHPRLQTVLGDLFIDALNQRRKAEPGLGSMIIETHSEHILLRLLRRIRETGKADIQHARFNLTPEDVAILYFEPDADETFVHHIRVSADGTFADRWPKGFFDERFEEIFDE